MDMELIDLKIFIAVVELSSATKAAKELAMTQPGVSQHLSRLESELGFRLFERNGKKLELNDIGRGFMDKARKLLSDAENLKVIGKGEMCPIGNLRLGLTDSSTITIIPKALSKFKKLYPGVKISCDVSDSGDIEHGVMRGHYDLGVITLGHKVSQMLDVKRLYFDRIDAIVSRSHSLAEKRTVSLKTLAEWPLLVYPRRSRTRMLIDDGFHVAGVHPKEIMEVFYNSGAVRLAEVGLGVALLSEAFIVSEMAKHKCVHLRIAGDPFKRAICAIRKNDSQLSEPAQFFYDILLQCI